jgi:hypothetical protein
MRNFLVMTVAGSVLSLGASSLGATAFSPGPKVTGFGAQVQNAQKSDEKGSSGMRGQEGGGKNSEPGAKSRDGGASQGKGNDRGAAQDQRDRGAHTRSGEKSGQTRTGERGEKGARGGERRTDIEVRGGRRDDRARTGGRTRVDIDVERRRRSGRRDADVNVRGYGYTAGNCQEIIRRYRQCVRR